MKYPIDLQAVHTAIKARTVCLLCTRSGTLASGVLIRVGGRYFVATAEHVLDAMDSPEAIVSRDGKRNIQISMNGSGMSKADDVGFLRIDDPSAFERIGRLFAEVSELATIRADESVPVVLVGYPSMLRSTEEKRSPVDPATLNRIHDVRTISLETVTVPISEWPQTERRHLATSGLDLFASFDPASDLGRVQLQPFGREDAETVSVPNIELQGASGCGMWVASGGEGTGVWLPTVAVAGIQSSVIGSFARVTPISRWLRLVADVLPDVAGDIPSSLLPSQ